VTAAETPRPRFATGVRLQWDEVREQHLLVFPEGVVTLNPSAAEVLDLCDGTRTHGEIIAELSARYSGSDVSGDVAQLLGALSERGLVIDAG
jgi:coenzyme PQQ biosynthesis protein PqqD